MCHSVCVSVFSVCVLSYFETFLCFSCNVIFFFFNKMYFHKTATEEIYLVQIWITCGYNDVLLFHLTISSLVCGK